MTAHEIHALAGAYAVDALDDLERARFEEHLAVCAECQAEVRSLADATLLLSELTPVAPPAALRDSVLADIKKIRPLPPTVSRVESRRPRRWAGLVAAAAVLGVLGGTAAVVQQAREDDTSQQPSVANQVLTADDAEHVNLDFVSGASATIYVSESVDRAVLVTKDMQPAPSGKVYQLWLQKDGRMVSAGLMDEAGDQTIALDGSAADATGAGITLEPAGGSTSPSLPALAEFDFSKSTT